MSTNKIKIAYVVNSLNLGGTENLVVQMSLAFKSEYDVFVLCLDEPGLWAATLRDQGVPVYGLRRQPGIDLAVAARIARFCRTNMVDIIHAHQCSAWFYSAVSRLLYPKAKLLFEEHGRHYPEIFSWKRNIINKLTIQHLTHKVIAVSHDTAERLVTHEGISPGKIRVVYNGVFPPQIISAAEREDLRLSLGIEPGAFLIGSVGRLDPIKNYPMLMKAFARLGHASSIRAVLIFVGDGPEYQDLAELAMSEGVAECCIFTGYRQDAIQVLQCLDLFVLCSFSEGTSMALLEAMATSVPAIVTAVGGNTDLVVDQQTGWVVSSDDVDQLHHAMEKVVVEYDKAREFARRGHERFIENFTFQSMIDSYGKEYEELACG